MKKVLFICSGGMSSTIVEKALEKEAEKNGIVLESSAVGTSKAEHAIKGNAWDIVLIAPQVKHRFNLFKEYADAENIRIELIAPRDYSPLGGKNLLAVVTNHH